MSKIEKNIICMKWGTAYGSDYVNVMARAVAEYLPKPYRFICLTDDDTGLDAGIEVFPLPNMDLPDALLKHGGWQKLCVFKPELFDISGDILVLDLDIIICGNLEPFFAKSGGLHAVYEWPKPRDYLMPWRNRGANTSVFRFTQGQQSQIYNRFMADPEKSVNECRIEQYFVTENANGMQYWPGDLVASFKKTLCAPKPFRYMLPPKRPALDTSIVAFHGFPNPNDLIQVPKPKDGFTKAGGYVSWVYEYWHKYRN